MRSIDLVNPAFISALPTELLLIVFKLVYISSRVPRPGPISSDPNNSEDDPEAPYETEWPREDLHVRTLFPYALSSVCTKWRDVMSLVPEFWTRIIIHTDAHDFSPSFLRAHLQWSRDLAIDITVLQQRANSFRNSKLLENSRLREIIDIVGPHVRRCRTLRFYVTYTSSLPNIASDFYGTAPNLTNLRLQASIGDGFGTSFHTNGPAEQFIYPMLQYLAIDGWNFVHLFTHASEWLERVFQTDRGSFDILSISHFEQDESEGRVTPGGRRFSLEEAWSYLSSAAIGLYLEDLDFDCELPLELEGNPTLNPPPQPHPPINPSPVVALFLIGLGSKLTASLLSHSRRDALPLAVLTVTHSPISDIRTEDFPANSDFITFDGIAHSPHDMARLLAHWQGQSLHVRKCPAFDDSVLDMLGRTFVDEHDEQLRFNAMNLRDLSLDGCVGFSMEALKRMVGERWERVALGGRLDSITIRRMPGVTEEDRDWLTERLLMGFSWRDEEG
ncbi:hypothetical protein Hypma_011158 [Hypsizygus marmoreus]|uniref:F-box domain-containing protein n=1 Tax=Hypsizygus marmoreus TaxID=39966 RepID=A0A369JKL4_HYPMA|nr:hypothetical protein Hypma_011158 [Hypsizygus marmoreus]